MLVFPAGSKAGVILDKTRVIPGMHDDRAAVE